MLHTTAHYVNFFNVEATQARPEKAWQIHYTQVGGITGHIMLLCMLLMYCTAQAKIRNKCFEAFWYTHHLAFIFMVALYSHASGCFVRDTVQPFSPFTQIKQFWTHCIGYQSFRVEIVFGILYAGERIWREVRARRTTRISKIVMHPQGVIEIQFLKPSMKYKSGQYLFLCVPEVSQFQWHPFTISSSPQDPFISVHIRQVGDWTEALGVRLGIVPKLSGDWPEKDDAAKALNHCTILPAIRVDGPFGTPAEDIIENRIAIICGAGIGVTPWASVLKDIYHRKRNMAGVKEIRLVRLEFIWICKDQDQFEWFQNFLAALLEDETKEFGLTHRLAAREFLKVRIFLTKKLSIDDIANYIINETDSIDPFTRLGTKTNFGRPNFDDILAQVRSEVDSGLYAQDTPRSRGKAQVGFYFCGPEAMGQSIQRSCHNQSTKSVAFKFKKEHF